VSSFIELYGRPVAAVAANIPAYCLRILIVENYYLPLQSENHQLIVGQHY
jgi:hypothetical protein